MRPGLMLAVALATALVAAMTTDAAIPGRVDCHDENLTFLFWPKGHPAIEAVRFPFFPHAHVEVYRTSGGRYPNRDQIGLVVLDANGMTGGGFSKSCASVRATAVDARRATATASVATALVCAFPAPGQLEYSKTRRSIVLRAVIPTAARVARLGVVASLAEGGSLVRYDRELCRATPPPR